ncbi:putative ribonuclease H-like domain-containing protein, partial [Tanacetum coccineum]
TGHFARECRTKGNQDSRRRDAWNSGNKDGRRSGKQEDSKALVTIDGEGVDWTSHSEEEEDYALMACNSSWSDTEEKILAEAQKEKEDLKAKVEKWHNSSKNISKLLNTQMSANDKFGLGYGDHRYDGILSYENEVLQSVFMGKESDFENPPLYDRFVTAGGMHATQPSESETQTSDIDTCESNISTEPPELVSEPVVNESNIESQPKVWSDAPIIEEYESDSEDEYVSLLTKEQKTPSFANQQVKTPRETVKNHFTHSKNPKVDKKELGYGFIARACFVCGSLNHLIRDCDFHEKRMAKQVVLNNRMKRNSSQMEIRPILNNVQRVNHQNQFVPTAVLTRIGKIPVNTARASGTKNVSTARHSFNRQDYPHRALQNKGIVDSGCSRHMTGNKAYLAEYQDFNGGPVAFGGSKGYITGKGKIKTRKLDFEDVCFVKELQHFNLFSVSQMCDKKNKVLFTDSECLVLSPEFKLPDENQVLLRIPRQNNMYSFNLENIVPSGGLACLIAKATIDESNKWHRRLGHVNFKNLNKLVKGNLVRGLPSNIFQNDHTCVACQKGKQHKASCKAKSVSSISHSLQLLHMDLFGPTSVRSLNHKTYCLVITDDFSSKRNTVMQNSTTKIRVAERKNKTLVEAARTMLADLFLPNTFWAEAACSVLNRRSIAKDAGDAPNKHPDLKTNGKPVDKEDQVFLDELERLKRQEKDANDAAEALRKSLLNKVEDLLLQAGAAIPCIKDSESLEFVDMPYGRRAIANTKWVYRNKKDEIEAIRIFLAFASYMGFIVYQMDVKSAFLYGKIDEEVYVSQPPGFIDPKYPQKVYKVVRALYGLHQAPRACQAKEDGIFISQDKYVAEILKKFDFINVKTASTQLRTPESPLVKMKASDVDVSSLYVHDWFFNVLDCFLAWTIVATSTLQSQNMLLLANAYDKIQYITPKQSILPLDFTSSGCYEKKLIQVLKIHTDDNIADLLTKAFDVSSVQCAQAFLTIGDEFQEVHWVFKYPWEEIKTHNMVAYLEKTEGNAEFHEVIDFLARSSIHHALTVSPVVSTTFVEQFWMSAKSKIINNVRYITAKVAGKPVSISEASIRSDLLFDDADGIDSLPNQAIFDAIQLMGYEGDLTVLTFNKALFSPQWRFLFHTMNHCISSKSTSWDQIPTNIATAVICLTSNQKYNFSKLIFDGMLRHLDAKKKFVMYPRFISIFLNKQLVNVPVPLDHFPVNALTSKVFSFMVKKGKHFSGKVTPLFASMLVQSTEDEGATSERPSEPQPTPSPPHPSEANVEPQSDPSPRPSPTPHIPDSILEVSGGNQGGQSSSDRSLSGTEGGMTLQSVYDLCFSLCTQVTDQAKEIKTLKAQIKKLKKQAKPVISHHRAWMKSISLKQMLAGKKSLKSNWMQKESVSKQGRKSAKAEPSVHKDLLFDELDDDEIDNMDTKDAQDMGRSRDVVNKEKENDDAEVSTEDVLSTAQQKVSTDKEKVSTDSTKVSTDRSKVSTDKEKDSTNRTDEGTDDQTEGRRATQTTQTSTSTMFGYDETIAQVLLNMSQAKAVSREKEKGVEFKDVKETERPRPTSTRSLLTLKHLPKIDPKDKGKKKIEEEDESKTKFDGIPEAEKKFKQLASDEEMARKQELRLIGFHLKGFKKKKDSDDDEDLHTSKELKVIALLALRLQDEEREQFTVEERAKFLHDTIATQRRFLVGQRAIAIRNKPPIRTQLRNQMMTYLKHVGKD